MPIAVIHPDGAEFATEPKAEKRPGHEFDEEGHLDDAPHERDHAGRCFQIERIAQKKALLQSHVPPRVNDHGRHDGHDAEAADLHQKQNDELAEERQIVAQIPECHAGDADGGHGGEKRVDKGNLARAGVADGEH